MLRKRKGKKGRKEERKKEMKEERKQARKKKTGKKERKRANNLNRSKGRKGKFCIEQGSSVLPQDAKMARTCLKFEKANKD